MNRKKISVNPILAAPVYLAGYIERAGTGTTDMVDLCRKAGLPDPEFIQDEDFHLIIRRKNVTPDVTPVNTVNQYVDKNVTPDVTPDVTPKMEKSVSRIKGELEMILGNKLVSTEEIAARFGVTIRTVRRDLNRLRASFRIEWIPTGPTSGYWEVSTRNDVPMGVATYKTADEMDPELLKALPPKEELKKLLQDKEGIEL